MIWVQFEGVPLAEQAGFWWTSEGLPLQNVLILINFYELPLTAYVDLDEVLKRTLTEHVDLDEILNHNAYCARWFWWYSEGHPLHNTMIWMKFWRITLKEHTDFEELLEDTLYIIYRFCRNSKDVPLTEYADSNNILKDKPCRIRPFRLSSKCGVPLQNMLILMKF